MSEEQKAVLRRDFKATNVESKMQYFGAQPEELLFFVKMQSSKTAEHGKRRDRLRDFRDGSRVCSNFQKLGHGGHRPTERPNWDKKCPICGKQKHDEATCWPTQKKTNTRPVNFNDE